MLVLAEVKIYIWGAENWKFFTESKKNFQFFYKTQSG